MAQADDTTKLASALSVTSALATGGGYSVVGTGYPSSEAVTINSITMGSTVGASTGANTISLSVSQARATAPIVGTYTLTLTYTATAN